MFDSPEQSQLARCARRHQDIKAHFLMTHHDPQEWHKVSNNPALFNQAWRKMLGIESGDMPPPIVYRR